VNSSRRSESPKGDLERPRNPRAMSGGGEMGRKKVIKISTKELQEEGDKRVREEKREPLRTRRSDERPRPGRGGKGQGKSRGKDR